MIAWLDPHIPNLGISRCPGSWTSSTEDDLYEFVSQGVNHVVCLQQEHELARLEPSESMSQRQDTLERLGMTLLHEPVEDFEAPSIEQAIRVTRDINQRLKLGQKVVVHCQAVLGRSGTIAACLLIQRGMSADGAISMVRWLRPGAVQSQVQEQLIAEFEHAFGRACE